MKFSKHRAKHLDNRNPSAILTAVRFKTDCYSPGCHHRDNTPEADLQLLDCGNRVNIHDFGETRASQLKKLDNIQKELDYLRLNINRAWDAYEKFWQGRE